MFSGMLSDRRVSLPRGFFAALFDLLVAAHFSLNFAQLGTTFLDLEKFIAGSERFPFQYRILTAPIFAFLVRAYTDFDVGRALPHFPDYLASVEALAYFTVNCGSLFIALLLFRRIAADVFAGAAAIAAYFLFVALCYLWFILNPGLSFLLPYDLPALAFCAASLLCVLRGRWYVLGAVFVLATLNRETSYLIVLLLLVRWYLGYEGSRALLVAAILGALWLVLKLALVFWFWPASGGLIISAVRIGYNFATLAKPWQWPALWPLILPVAVGVFGWRVAVARPWAITVAIGFLSLFCVANITELRAYGDLIPFVVLAMTAVFADQGPDGAQTPPATAAR
jgi:hypothetical protein